MAAIQKVNRGPSAGPENRRAIIAAAREVFATSGYAAPLSSIAKKAGVGQGSLYRHFPDRVALAVAVFEENVDDIDALVAQPDTTLDDVLDLIADQALVSTSLIELMSAKQDDPTVVHLGERVRTIIDKELQVEQAAGRVGTHVDTDDVLLAVSMLAEVLTTTHVDARPEVARRARALFHAAFAPR